MNQMIGKKSFDEILNGKKKSVIGLSRMSQHAYNIDDMLTLEEVDDTKMEITGRVLNIKITYIDKITIGDIYYIPIISFDVINGENI
jgi:hypothetical protein